MKISTKGRYALCFIIELAKQPSDQYVALKEVCESQHISKKYLEQIIPLMSKMDFLDAIRGNNGGYRLKKDPKDISLYDILSSTENESRLVKCVDVALCERSHLCHSRPVWLELDALVLDFLKNKTIQDILDDEDSQTASNQHYL
ncbi:Rrf2 family transcriptional regulator [Peptoniphilus sp. KCTC 25270]|uniref:RrF2 family transcriptional regulator n=1 Tax=Peptoniphilus sp. KCTC 25270 TaxID=2897414 RepID=UPI001E579D92|nr:Rrf2 family transcriptional regulator [Peptoniphilus sp. KCTC 25270]MCD1146659.1 Rrf2 family transcriptional regulator [Peptoniphilus sp. KCTC 25270]